jgi:hypothetical protein
MARTKAPTYIADVIEYIDLLTDKNQIVRIEVPSKYVDETYDYLDGAMKSDDWFSTARYDGTSMSLNGTTLSRIHMSRIVGML